MVTFCVDLQQAGNLHSCTQEDRVKHLFPRVLWKLPSLGQSAHQIGEAKHLVEISLEPVPGSNLAIFLFFEKPLQVELADGSGGSVKASAHLDLLAHHLNQFRRNVESLRLAVNQHGDLILRMQTFAVGTMTAGPAAGARAFDKRAGQHFAESIEAADEFAAQSQVGFARCFQMTLPSLDPRAFSCHWEKC